MGTPDTPLAALEARDSSADCATVGSRIESFRRREPATQPKLLIDRRGTTSKASSAQIPEIGANALTASALREAIAGHGALIVRNLFSRQSTEIMRLATDRVIDACADAGSAPPPGTYFNPPENLRSIMPNKDRELGNTRNFHRESGSAMCVEAPSVAESLLQLYEHHGLKELLKQYLGESPCLTVKKWVLRRSVLPVTEAGWHQDGAFMGTDINSINMWIPLSGCGGETGAPGMDVIPLRLYDIVSSDGAQFNWSVSDELTGKLQQDGPLKPVFNEGDAFFFDHFYLHRTQYRTDFSRLRYAVETWFFGETAFPKNQIPLAW